MSHDRRMRRANERQLDSSVAYDSKPYRRLVDRAIYSMNGLLEIGLR
jgi:hypothetical protein